MATDEDIDRVEQSMITAREDAIAKGHVCNFRTLARAAISEMRAIEREKAEDRDRRLAKQAHNIPTGQPWPSGFRGT